MKEYIVERDDAGSPPREPADALDTARVGHQFLRTVRFQVPRFPDSERMVGRGRPMRRSAAILVAVILAAGMAADPTTGLAR